MEPGHWTTKPVFTWLQTFPVQEEDSSFSCRAVIVINDFVRESMISIS